MSEFMRNMLNRTSDGTPDGDLGVIHKHWNSEPTETQKWLYIVGDGETPGSYTRIDGYCLCDEGSFKLSHGEDPMEAAHVVKAEFSQMDDMLQIAIVTVIVDSDGDAIYSEVTQVV